MPNRSFALAAMLIAAVSLLASACDDGGSGTHTVEKLFAPQGNQLDVYDLVTGQSTVLIPAEQNTVNGQTCLLPDGSGNFLLGEDTDQESGARQGWGIFTPDGTFVKKILEPRNDGEAKQIEPYSCAFDTEGRLFTTDVGTGSFDSTDGKLMLFFPDDYEEACILDPEVRVAGRVIVDDDGNVLVAETVPPGHILRYAPPFPANVEECATVKPEKSVFIEDPDMSTPIGIARAPNGNWYISSVFLPTAIREYTPDGTFVRTVIEGDAIGNPAGLAFASDGTLYYADLGLEQKPGELPGPAAGKSTVRRVRFDADGNAQTPQVIGSGLDYADAVAIIEIEEE